MPKTIAFIDNFDEVEMFLKKFHSCADKDTIYIAGDALAYAALNKRGIPCKALDYYRNLKQYEEAEKYALDMAGKWFVDFEGSDFTQFEGISIGKCMKKDVYSFLKYVLKAILDISNILKQENPKEVLLMSDYQTPITVFGKGNLLLHKQVFLLLMKDNEYEIETCEVGNNSIFSKLNDFLKQISFQKHSILSAKFVYYCPPILTSLFKKLVIMATDGVKAFLSNDKNNFPSVRALTLSASDLTYFGNDLIKSYSKRSNCYLYYLEDENNCYFNSQILRVPKKKYYSLIENKNKKDFLSNLKLRFKRVKEREKHSTKWTFMGLSLLCLSEKYFIWIIDEKIPELISFFQSAENAIKKCNINIVLICERWGAKRTILTQIAKNKGIPVLHIPHSVEPGIIDGNKIIVPDGIDIKHFLFCPTHEVSSLKYQQQIQKKRGINENKLFLTGIPRYGSFKPKSQKSLYNARKRLGFSMDEEIVFIHFRPIFRYYYDKMITNDQFSTFELSHLYESFIQYISKRKNSKIVFKLKMSDLCSSLICNITPRNAASNVIILKDHLQDILTASDAVVVTHSTVAIEALYCDTPVIVYKDSRKLSFLSLCAMKAAIEINSPKEIVPILDRLRNDESYREERLNSQSDFLKRNLPDDNLSAAERVSEVIMKLANHNKIGRNSK